MSLGTNISQIGVIGEEAIRAFPLEAEKLPPAGQRWIASDIGLSLAATKRFARASVIRKAGYESRKTNRSYWETTPGVHDWVQTNIAIREKTPCGQATGVRNLGDDGFTCTNDSCDCRMDRETALEVVE